MARFLVQGGRRLQGTIIPQGAKNEALQVISAVLLTSEPVVLEQVPRIKDVQELIHLLQIIGVRVTCLHQGDPLKDAGDTWEFCAADLDHKALNSEEFIEKCTRLRGSIMLLAPLLHRVGKIALPRPGGDKIGRRRIDTHLLGLQTLGASFDWDARTGRYMGRVNRWKPAFIHLDEASVTGTANLLMAAVLIPGTTTLYHAACEPYVQQLCRMLVGMGARIEGIGSNRLVVHGTSQLKGIQHRLLPDMIEVGSFIGMAALTQSSLTIQGAGVEHLGMIPQVFQRLGIELQVKGDDIYVPAQDHYAIQSFIDGSIPSVSDAPWPGFTPDLLSIVLVTAIQAKGALLVHQKMFESRLFFVDKLIDMGAQIILCDPHRATVIGLDRMARLRGITMSSPDIRAGVSLLLAAMSAEGISQISNIEQIDRGYQYLDVRLNKLGASIERLD